MFKKLLKVCLIVALLVMSTASLCSCFDIDDTIIDLGFYKDSKKVNNKYTVIFRECPGVMLDEKDEGAIRKVTSGSKVKFKVKMSENYIYLGNTVGAKFDSKTNEIVLDDVTAPVTIDLILISKSELYSVDVFTNHTKGQFTFVKGGAWSAEPTDITVKAIVPSGYVFRGWSKGNFLVNNGILLSTELEYSFTQTKDDKNTKLYANFESESEYKITYDPNGGRLNGQPDTTYTVQGEYSDMFLLQQTLYDGNPDVTFKREGYIPIGYSSEPALFYSSYESANYIPGFSNLGGVCEVPKDTGALTLYVVWAEVTADAAFVYETVTYNDIWYANDTNGNGVQQSEVSKGTMTGVVITDYRSMYNSGSKNTIVIPDYINNLPVIGIAKDAFANKPNVKKVVIPKTVMKIESGAFSKCNDLREVVFFDSLQYVYNGSFSSSVKTIVMNSTKLPTYAGTGEGSFCIKYERVRYYRNEKKMIVLSGSSTLNGLNSKMLYDNFNGEYEIVNYGTNAGTQMLFYLEMISNYTTEGDVVVYAPEWTSGGPMGDTTIHWKMFRGNNQCYDIFREVDMSRYSNFWDAYVTCQIGKLIRPSQDGDWAGLQTGKQYQHPSTGMNKYGDLLGNRNANNNNWNDSMMFDNQMNQARAGNINRVNAQVVAKGGTVLFSFGTADAASVARKDSAWKSKADAFTQKCADLLDCPVISNVGTYVMGENDKNVGSSKQEMYNSAWHCTYYGANVRTVELTYDVKKYIDAAVKNDTWESYTVRESHRNKSAYKTYEYADWN